MKNDMPTAIEVVEGIKNGSLSCEDLLSNIYERIERSKLNCYITLNKDAALEKAIEVDKRRNEEEYGRKKLLGVTNEKST
jgi:Asp-tRNA(Asn)/Glu-tRNA(Gln) amidotransferase A subunit family amidase